MTLAPVVHKPAKKAKQRRRVPKALIYEMRHGRPIYYRDYEKVLAGELPLEAVMGSSKLQWWILQIILRFLFAHLDLDKYLIALNEVGFKYAPRSWRNLDIAIFEREKVLAEGLTDEYVETPPLVVIEVDTKADLGRYEGQVEWYMREKTDDLLNAGVGRVIWYTTRDKRVLVAERGKRWFLTTWDDPIEVIDGVVFNLAELLAEEGIDLEALKR